MYGEKSSMIVQRLPHARGGVSTPEFFHDFSLVSSPRTWGCFRHVAAVEHQPAVFPTHVGVFPYMSLSR